MSKQLNTTKYPSTTVIAATISSRGDNALEDEEGSGCLLLPKSLWEEGKGAVQMAYFAMLPA